MSEGAREVVLGRIRRALADVPESERPEDVPVVRHYRAGGIPPAGSVEVVDLFAERLADYGAAVRLVTDEAAAITTAIAGALSARGARRVLVPPGFPEDWTASFTGVEVLSDEPRRPVADLDAADGVVTVAAAAIAITGTIMLDGGAGQGRRALSLVPDYHLCVIRADQVVASVPEALAKVYPSGAVTFISGPSATSDIELSRVKGVHGPRTLEVIIVR